MKTYQIAPALLVFVLNSQMLTAKFKHDQWRQVSSKETNGFGTMYVSRSRIACGRQCSNYRGCYLYCFNNITSTCYIKTRTSSVFILSENEAVQCYKHKCAFREGYLPYGGRCIQLFTDKLSYQNARQRCKQDGAHLYHIKTSDDKQPLSDIMGDNGLAIVDENTMLWLGADDLSKEGTFVWSDGVILPSDSDLWVSSNPDNLYFGMEDCVVIDGDYLLMDFRCNLKFLYVCQQDIWQ